LSALELPRLIATISLTCINKELERIAETERLLTAEGQFRVKVQRRADQMKVRSARNCGTWDKVNPVLFADLSIGRNRADPARPAESID
jgi:hypothetical protein